MRASSTSTSANISCALFVLGLGLGLPGAAAAQAPKSLDELLKEVQQGYRTESQKLKTLEAEFKAAHDKQAQLLASARAQLKAEEKRGEQLEREFESNEKLTAELEETLRIRLGTMGELFGVIRQIAGDTRAQVAKSMITAQYTDRDEQLKDLAQSESLPEIKQLEKLWFVLQHEMTESGKTVRFKAPVVSAAGVEQPQEIARVGVFNAVSQGKYLQWMEDTQRLAELPRQPPPNHQAGAQELLSAKSGFVRFSVDPARGSILRLLVQTPSIRERLEFGGVIGYIIIGLGIFAVLLAVLRFLDLTFVSLKIRSQLNDPNPRTNNPLGRIMLVQKNHPHLDPEALERKFDEAIIRETGRLERLLWLIKVVSVSAPLLGLLGTVTGMIRTFQAITLYGTGDPKLMAGGISEALVTTMLGLFVAIPLVLLYAGLASMSKRQIDVLEEQSIGLVAQRVEQAAAAQAVGPEEERVEDSGD